MEITGAETDPYRWGWEAVSSVSEAMVHLSIAWPTMGASSGFRE